MSVGLFHLYRGSRLWRLYLKPWGLSKGDNTVLAEIMFDKAVSLTIFRSIIHPNCSLFIHSLTARHHGGQGVKNLLFTSCVIGCLARYHQVSVHTAELPGFHSTPGVGLFSKHMLFQYLTPFLLCSASCSASWNFSRVKIYSVSAMLTSIFWVNLLYKI